MTKEISSIPADQFKWKGCYGYTCVDKLGYMPNNFFCISPKTMRIKHFTVNEQDPGYEDQWDGVVRRFVDDERKLFIDVHYEEPWL